MEKVSLRTSQDNIQKLILESEKYTKETSQFFKHSHSHQIPRSESLPVHSFPQQKALNPLNDSQKHNNNKPKPPSKPEIPTSKPPNLLDLKDKGHSKGTTNNQSLAQIPTKPKIINNPPAAFNKNLLRNCNVALTLINKDLNMLNVPTIDKASLQFLNISSNKFKRFPEELRQLPNLKSIKIDHNFIKTLPQWLSNSFKYLEILSISDNLLQDLSFLDSGDLKNFLGVSLRFLDVSFNHIDHVPIQMHHLKELKALRIHNNDFLCIPTSIKNITNLQEFTLDWFKYIKHDENQSLNDSIFKSLKQRFHIYFSLNQEQFTDLINEGRASRNIIEILNALLKKLEVEDEKASCYFMDLVGFFQEGSDYTLDVNKIYKESGQSIMHKAVVNEEISVMKSLIFYEFENLNILDVHHNTALSLAIQEERYFAAKVLIYNGANVEIGGDFMGNCLNLATAKLQIFLIEDLLKFGANPNGKDAEGNSSLHYLASIFSKDVEKSTKIMTKLLESGAQPNIKNQDLWSPLHIAVKREQISAIKFMIFWNKGLKSQAPSPFANNGNSSNTKKIIRKPFKINKRGGIEKWTPLHIAVSVTNYEIIMILLENKADIYLTNIHNMKPVGYCRSGGVLKLLRIHEKKILSVLKCSTSDLLKRSFIQNTRTNDKNSDIDEEKSRVIENLLEIEEEKAVKNLILGCNDINKIEKFNRFMQKPSIAKIESTFINKESRILRSKSTSELLNINKIYGFLQNFHNQYKNSQFSLVKYQKLIIDGFGHYSVADLVGYITAMKLIYYKLLEEISILEGNSITLETVQRFLHQKAEIKEIFQAFKESYFALQRAFVEMIRDILKKYRPELEENKEKGRKAYIIIENLSSFMGRERKKGGNEEIHRLFIKETNEKIKEVYKLLGKMSFLQVEISFMVGILNSKDNKLVGCSPVVKTVGISERDRKDHHKIGKK